MAYPEAYDPDLEGPRSGSRRMSSATAEAATVATVIERGVAAAPEPHWDTCDTCFGVGVEILQVGGYSFARNCRCMAGQKYDQSFRVAASKIRGY